LSHQDETGKKDFLKRDQGIEKWIGKRVKIVACCLGNAVTDHPQGENGKVYHHESNSSSGRCHMIRERSARDLQLVVSQSPKATALTIDVTEQLIGTLPIISR
jgi:hypothetical protein